MKIYVVRNKDGKYFRSIGRDGWNKKNWVDDLKDAKFYSKRGAAVGRVTFFANKYPDYGIPELLEFDISLENATIVDNKAETEKKMEKKKEEVLQREWRNRDNEIQRLQHQKEKIAARLRDLKE